MSRRWSVYELAEYEGISLEEADQRLWDAAELESDRRRDQLTEKHYDQICTPPLRSPIHRPEETSTRGEHAPDDHEFTA